MRSTIGLRALAALSLIAGLAGCGGNDGGDSVDDDSGRVRGRVVAKVLEAPRIGVPADVGQWMVEIETDPDGDLAYTVGKVVSPPGNINLHLVNPQSAGHDLTIEELGAGSVQTEAIREESAWLRVSLFEDEKYVFYCSVPGHRAAGMEGTIEVDQRLEAADLEAF